MTERRGMPEEPRLDVTLLANGGESARLYRGEPLLLSVQVVDQEAARLAAHNESIDEAREDLESRQASGEVPPGELGKERSALRPMRGKTVRLGTKQSPWARQIRFLTKAGGRAVVWPLKLLANPAPPLVVDLVAGRVAVADFGLDGSEVDRVKPATYAVQATVRSGSVRVTTDPVEVTVTRKSAPEELRLRVALAAARFAYRTESYAAAQAQIERALALDPHSIEGLVLLADVALATGRPDTALAALERALAEARAQYPDAYEPPAPILRRLATVNRILFGGTDETDPFEGLPPLV